MRPLNSSAGKPFKLTTTDRACSRPLSACISTATAGEAHDNRLAGSLLSRLKSGSMLLADRGYDADWILVTRRRAWATYLREAIATSRSVSAHISTEPATWSNGSSIRSNSVDGSRRNRNDSQRFVGWGMKLKRGGSGRSKPTTMSGGLSLLVIVGLFGVGLTLLH
jgi:hypothetical protein